MVGVLGNEGADPLRTKSGGGKSGKGESSKQVGNN